MSIFGAGHEVVTSTTRPATPTIGQIIFETDTLSYRWYNGTAWEGVTPIGTIQPFAGTTAPSGWRFCDGGAGTGAGTGTLNGSAGQPFSDLWLAIGNAFNVAGVRAAFYLPDMRGRIPSGKSTNLTYNAVGNSDITAEPSRAPIHSHGISHTHTMASHTHDDGSYFAKRVMGGGVEYLQTGGSASWTSNTRLATGGPVGDTNNFSGGTKVGGTSGGPSTNTTDSMSIASSVPAGPSYLVTNYIIKI